MNLFRSEGHVRNWSGFKAGTEAGILPLGDFMEIFKTPRHRLKFSGDYITAAPDYVAEFHARLKAVTGGAEFWDPTPPTNCAGQ